MNLPLIIADRCSGTFVVSLRKFLRTAIYGLRISIDTINGERPSLEWKRPRGRPRRMCLDQIEEDLGVPVSVAYVTAQGLDDLEIVTHLAHQ